MCKPKSYQGNGSFLIEDDKRYSEAKFIFQKEGISNVDKMTVYDWYSTTQIIKANQSLDGK